MTEDQRNQYCHFVSVTLIEAMNCFERGAMSKVQLLALVDYFESQSIDERQRNFFVPYRKLVDRVEESIR